MKKIKYILLCISFIYCEQNIALLYSYNEPILNYSNYSGKDAIKSVIVPGWGQYSRGNHEKAFIFLCVESIALGVYYNYNNKGIQKEKSTRKFGDEHWSFSTWVTDYYNFDIPEYSYIFEREETGSYKEIWEGGHKLEFTYDDKYHTTGSAFEEFYNQKLCLNCPERENVLDSIYVDKDHHYYENIGKYDHFFSGWDDNEEISLHIKESGELIAMSPNKKTYRDDWEISAEFNRFADYALYTVYTNHIISLLDILVFSKINKNSKFNYKLRTIYNPDNNLGIGGVQILVSW